jgi:hypothetical protein
MEVSTYSSPSPLPASSLAKHLRRTIGLLQSTDHGQPGLGDFQEMRLFVPEAVVTSSELEENTLQLFSA